MGNGNGNGGFRLMQKRGCACEGGDGHADGHVHAGNGMEAPLCGNGMERKEGITLCSVVESTWSVLAGSGSSGEARSPQND